MKRRAGRMRWGCTVAVVAFVALLAALGEMYRRAQPRPDPFAKVLFEQKPVTLAPGIHLLGRLFPSAAYAVETSQGLVLIDAGLAPDAALLREQLTELGLDVSKLRAIFLTHAHGDHTLGARYLRDTTGAKIYAGQGDCEVLRIGGPREAFFSTFDMDDNELHPTPVDVELAGGESFAFGDVHIEAIATPGHTPGSTCYLLRRGELRVLFTGDTVSSLAGDVGTYAALLAPRYRANARDYLQTLLKLRAMPAPDLVLPGHPAASSTPHGPRLGKTGWRGVLDRGIADLHGALARSERDGDDFLDGTPKQLLPGLHYLGDYSDHAIYVLETPQGRFIFDAPGDAGFADFLRAGMKNVGVNVSSLTAVVLTSCDPEASAGLDAIVRETRCTVVAPGAGLDSVASRCPAGTTILAAEDLPGADWFDVQVFSLAGRGASPTAFLISWQDKRVLVSGTIPIKFSQQSREQLKTALQPSPDNARDYKQSLERLGDLHPDLWLPAWPVHAQNANLYDDDWEKVLGQNLQVCDSLPSAAVPPP